MNALLLSAVLFTQAPATPQAKPGEPAPTAKVDAAKSLDGNWTVVCYEHDGKPMAEAKDCQVMIKDNVATFTCKDDKNKIKAMRFECGEKGTIRATEVDPKSEGKPADAKTMAGVCVRTADFIAICVHPTDANTKTGTDGKPGTETGDNAKAGCTVILKRAGAAENK